MRKQFLLFGVIFLTAVIVIMGCGSTKQLTEGSEQKLSDGDAPDWALNYQKHNTDSQRAVVGVSKNYAMESSARRDAILQAQKEAITLISSSVARHTKEALSAAGADADIVTEATASNDVTEVISRSEFQGEVKEYYVEKWERMTGGAKKQYYKAYVLLLYPNNLAEISAKKALAKAAEQEEDQLKREQIKKAEDLLQKQVFDW